MTGEEPPYLTVGTDVSAKYKGAFCEAKIKKVVRSVKCKVNFKNNNGSALVTDDLVRGTLRVGAHVEAKHPDKNQYMEGIVNKLHDYSQYTVVFDDGDETTLRRTSLCLKSGRHFAESETLDQLPLTHPEHFGTPVMGMNRGRKRRTLRRSPMMGDASSDDETPPPISRKKEASKPKDQDPDTGKVVCVDVSDKKKQARDNWFPGLVVSPGAQESIRIKGKEEYLVRSFKDGKYHVVLKKDAREFTREIGSKVDNNTLKTAVERAMLYVEKDELPPHWDRESLFRAEYSSNDGNSDQDSDSDVSDDEPSEAKDRFVAQLYKFMDDRGTPINKAPSVSSRDLNLYKLFKVVQKSGGYNRVTNQMQWKSVYTKLGLPATNSSASHQIKQAYKKYLHSFEGFERKLGCTMGTSTRSGRVRHRSERNLMVTRDRDREFKTVGRRKKESKQGLDDKSKISDVEVKLENSDKSQDETDAGSEKADEVVASPEKSGTETIQVKKERSLLKASKEAESKSSDTDDDRKSKPGRPRSSDDSKRDESPSTRRRGRKKLIKVEKPDEDDKSQDSDDEYEDSRFDVLISVGDKVRVKYGRGRQQKIYEAKVLKTDTNDDNDRIYFVHYTGWNMRYDEWVKRHRIVKNLTQKIPEKRFRQSGSKFKLGKRGRPHGSYSCSPKLALGSQGPVKGERSDRGSRRGGSVTRSRTTRSETRNSRLDSPSFPNGLEPQRRHGKSSGSSESESDGESDADAVVRRTRSAKRDEDADTSIEEKDKYEFVDDDDEIAKKSDDERESERRSAKSSTKMGVSRRLKKDNSSDVSASKSSSIRKGGLSRERRTAGSDEDDVRGADGDGKAKQQLRKLRAKSTKPAAEETKKVERRGRKKKQPLVQPQQQQPAVSDDESDDGDKDGDDTSQNEGVMDSELYFFESSKKDTTSEAENSVIEDSESCFVSDVMAATTKSSGSGGGDVSETDFTKHEDDTSFLDVASSLFKPLDNEPIVSSVSKEGLLPTVTTPVIMPNLDKEEPVAKPVEPIQSADNKTPSAEDVDDENEDQASAKVESPTINNVAMVVSDKISVMPEAEPVVIAANLESDTLKIEPTVSNVVPAENLNKTFLDIQVHPVLVLPPPPPPPLPPPPPPLEKVKEVQVELDDNKPIEATEQPKLDVEVPVIKDIAAITVATTVVSEVEKITEEPSTAPQEEKIVEKIPLIGPAPLEKLDSASASVAVEDKVKSELKTTESICTSVAAVLSSADSSEEEAFQVKRASELPDNGEISKEPQPLAPPPSSSAVILDKFDALLQDIPWRKISCVTPSESPVAAVVASSLVSKEPATPTKASVAEAEVSVSSKASKKEKSRKQKTKKSEKRKASESDTDEEEAAVIAATVAEDEPKAKKRRTKDDDKKDQSVASSSAAAAATSSAGTGGKTKSSSKKSKERKKSKKVAESDRDDTKKSRRKECKRKKETSERSRGKDREDKRVDSDDVSSVSSSELSPVKKKIKKTRKHAAAAVNEVVDKKKSAKETAKKIKSNEEHTSDDSKKSLRKNKGSSSSSSKRKEKQQQQLEKSSKKESVLPTLQPSSDDSDSSKVSGPAIAAGAAAPVVGFEPIDDVNKQIATADAKLEAATTADNSECNVPSYLICEEDVPASPVGADVNPAELPTVETAATDNIKPEPTSCTSIDAPSMSIAVTSSSASSPPHRISAFTPVTSTQQKQGRNDPSVVVITQQPPSPMVAAATTPSETEDASCGANQLSKAATSPSSSPLRDAETTSSAAASNAAKVSQESGSSDDVTGIVDDRDKTDVNADKISAASSSKRPGTATTSLAVASAVSEDASPPTTKRRRRNYKKQPIGESIVVDLPPRRANSPGLSAAQQTSRHRPSINKPLRSSENEEFVHMADMFLGVANSTLHHHHPMTATATHGDIHTRLFSAATASPPLPPPLPPLQHSLPLQPQLLPPVPHSPTKPSKFNFYTELDDFLDGSERIAVLQDRLTELRRTYLSLKAELACIDRRRKKLKRKEKEAASTAPASGSSSTGECSL